MVISYAAEIGFEILHLEYSPIKGPEGNIEYLLHLRKPETDPADRGSAETNPVGETGADEILEHLPFSPEQVVEDAHGELDKG